MKRVDAPLNCGDPGARATRGNKGKGADRRKGEDQATGREKGNPLLFGPPSPLLPHLEATSSPGDTASTAGIVGRRLPHLHLRSLPSEPLAPGAGASNIRVRATLGDHARSVVIATHSYTPLILRLPRETGSPLCWRPFARQRHAGDRYQGLVSPLCLVQSFFRPPTQLRRLEPRGLSFSDWDRDRTLADSARAAFSSPRTTRSRA